MKDQENLPEYEILRVRSVADIQAAELLMASELYDHAVEQCHFGLEKIMKAALIKQMLGRHSRDAMGITS